MTVLVDEMNTSLHKKERVTKQREKNKDRLQSAASSPISNNDQGISHHLKKEQLKNFRLVTTFTIRSYRRLALTATQDMVWNPLEGCLEVGHPDPRTTSLPVSTCLGTLEKSPGLLTSKVKSHKNHHNLHHPQNSSQNNPSSTKHPSRTFTTTQPPLKTGSRRTFRIINNISPNRRGRP